MYRLLTHPTNPCKNGILDLDEFWTLDQMFRAYEIIEAYDAYEEVKIQKDKENQNKK